MKIEEIKKIIVTELAEYCKKNNFTDVVFGLSGGIDSALVLAISCEALGSEHVHAIMMKTKYTSQESLDLAKQIAEINKVDYKMLDIQDTVDSMQKSLGFSTKKPVTLQNIQARVRGVIAMAYSNDNNWLLLACSNKSEAAMGYCTLYGDTCGGLTPIGDLFKTQVYELANLFNKEKKFFIPVEIIDRAPTAELCTGQKDSDSLPPYSELDEILQKYVYGSEKIPAKLVQKVSTIKEKYEKMAFKRAQCPPVIKIEK